MLQIIDLRETRRAARELKFLAPASATDALIAMARASLAPDPHGTGEGGSEYRTSTIYLDTPDRMVRRRAGSYGRSKFRIRRYGEADVAFVERKLRTGRLLSKRRTIVPLVDLPDLLPADIGSARPTWFTRRLAVRALEPVCQITYRRQAFVGEGAWGPLRLTIDDGIVAQPHGSACFAEPRGTTLLAGSVVVEMKFCLEAPAVLKHIVEAFGLSPTPMSKYRIAMDQLEPGPDATMGTDATNHPSRVGVGAAEIVTSA